MTRGQLPQRAGSLGLTAVGLLPRYPQHEWQTLYNSATEHDGETDGHLADVERMKRCTADNHLKTFAVRCHLRYLLVYASDEVSVAAGQQSVLHTQQH